MLHDWLELSLGDVITLQRGFDLPNRERIPGNVPVVSSSGISGIHSEAKVSAPGVVTGRYGTIGQVFYIKEDYWPLNTTLFVKDFKGNDPLFVSFLLRTIDFLSCSDKSSVPGLNRNDLHLIKVKLPPLSEQKAIAHILGTLDDKIELNREMNQTLEAMARAIFKSWFVDFDPVRAKMEGRQPAGMDAATAELFPDEFEESALGIIPKGWKVGTLGDLGKIVTGKTPSTKFSKYFCGSVPFITPSDMDGRKMISRTARYLTQEGVNAVKSAKVPAGAIMVSCIGSDMGKVTCAVKDSVTNQQINSIIVSNFYLREYVYYDLSLRKDELQNLAGGGSAVPILNKGHFSQVEILIPHHLLLKSFEILANPIAKKIYDNDDQSHTLASIRDTLLPKLLSGEIRVKEAEKLLETVA